MTTRLRRRTFLAATVISLCEPRARGQETASKGEARGKAGARQRRALKPVPPPVTPPARPDPALARGLEAIRAKHNLPGMVGGVVRGTSLVSAAACGVRKLGSEEPFRVADLVHLGSDTKAMTATMIGTVVEDGLLQWGSTVAGVFPEQAGSLHPDFRKVTLWQLLTHRAGLPDSGPWWELRGRGTTAQRRDLLARMMGRAPESAPGSTYRYSNVGYALAGLMAEQVTGRPWEDLMRDRLFGPLGMTTAGFGPPGPRGKLNQPWGHLPKGDSAEPMQHDNAPALGPAGTVHCTPADWAKFIGLHLQAARGQGQARLLEPATFRKLHTPVPGGGDYAGGWIVLDRPWAGGRALTHSGSNTMWYCTTWVAPARNFAILVATNQGGDAAAAACDEACGVLIGRAAAPAPRARG